MTSGSPSGTEGLPYRPCIGITLINADGLVFVGHRITSDERVHWQMPQGGIDHGESPRQAALRELGEEVGTNKARIVGESREWFSYELPRPMIGRTWRGRFRGQKQKWFAMRFEGTDADINIAAHQPPEFDDWKWVRFSEVVDLIIPFKRAVYEQVVKEFAPLVVPLQSGSRE
jgi:putative (di)nucleoside polyphosphate hydrolase